MRAVPLFVLVLSLLPTSPSKASDFYVFGTAGRASFDVDQQTIDAALRRGGALELSSAVDRATLGWKVQAGYRLSRVFSIEGGYVRLGSGRYEARFKGGEAQGTIRAEGPNLAIRAAASLDARCEVFAKIGVINAKAHTQMRSSSILANIASVNLRPKYRCGIELSVTCKSRRAAHRI